MRATCSRLSPRCLVATRFTPRLGLPDATDLLCGPSRRRDEDDDENPADNRNKLTARSAPERSLRLESCQYFQQRQLSSLANPTLASTIHASPQRRQYHATTQQPLVLYGTIIIVVATGYVIYRKSQGKPIAPDSLIDAKAEFKASEGKFSQAAFERRQAAKKLQKQKENSKESEDGKQ